MPTDPQGGDPGQVDRRAELLRQAEHLIVERGYAGTRMVDVARAAGVSKSLVYWYFETKDDLVHEIALDVGRRLRAVQRSALLAVDDPLDRLYLGTVASVQFIAAHHRLYEMLATQMRVDRGLRTVQRRSRQVLADDVAALVAEGQDRGLVRLDEDPAALARASAGLVTGLVLLSGAVRDEDAVVRDAAVEALAHEAARFVVHAVAADTSRAVATVARWSGAPQGHHGVAAPPGGD